MKRPVQAQEMCGRQIPRISQRCDADRNRVGKLLNNIVALIYDFDNTLSTKDMQEFTFIPSLGMDPSEFWRMSDELSHKYQMDHILAYMYLMATQARQKNIHLTYNSLKEMGNDVVFFDGVKEWFGRINEYGKKHNDVVFFDGVKEWFGRINEYGKKLGLEVRHYIISCGLKPMIEGCPIGNEFYNVFACDYVYDDNGEPIWPSVAINYTSKTQFLYRINKGVEDVGEHKKLNMYMPTNERAVPFTHMIYIGDGLTDVPSMKLARSRGGYAVGVYRKPSDASYLVAEDRVDFYVKCDYTPESEMDRAMKSILEKICAQEKFEELSEESFKSVNKQ